MRIKYIVVLIQIAAIISCSTNKNKALYLNADPLSESKFDKACGCTIEKHFYKSGKLAGIDYRYAKPNDTASFLDGPSVQYFENGNIRKYRYFNKGILDSIAFALYENGDTACVGTYANGLKNGNWRTFDSSTHQIVEEKEYDESLAAVNTDKEFYTQKIYDDNKVYLTKRIENGVVVSEQKMDTTLYALKQQTTNGRMLFIAHCSTCHGIDEDVMGPKLRGITVRRRAAWLYSFVVDGDAMYHSGDALAVELYNRWHLAKHPSGKSLSAEEIRKIIQYLKQNS